MTSEHLRQGDLHWLFCVSDHFARGGEPGVMMELSAIPLET